MRLVQPIRHRLGLAKHRLYHDMAYRPAMRRSAVYRERIRSEILALPPLAAGPGDPVEIHMLCGKAHFDMGVIASWSLMRYLPAATLYVHSDGTLGHAQIESWRAVIENVQLVPKPEADELVKDRIAADFPLLWQWRERNWAAYQVTDYSLFGTTPTLISLDSDVLCLADPTFLRQHLDTTELLWNEDVRTCYSGDPVALSAATDLNLPLKLNCGFLLMPRLTTADFAALEAALVKLTALDWFDSNHPYSSQAYLAIIAAAQGRGGALPEQYRVYHGRTRPGTIVRHYVGVPSIRSRFFGEGVPLVLAQAHDAR